MKRTTIIIATLAIIFLFATMTSGQCSFYKPAQPTCPISTETITAEGRFWPKDDYVYFGEYGYITYSVQTIYTFDRNDFSLAIDEVNYGLVQMTYLKSANGVLISIDSPHLHMTNNAFDKVCFDEYGDYYAATSGRYFAFISRNVFAIIDMRDQSIYEYSK